MFKIIYEYASDTLTGWIEYTHQDDDQYPFEEEEEPYRSEWIANHLKDHEWFGPSTKPIKCMGTSNTTIKCIGPSNQTIKEYIEWKMGKSFQDFDRVNEMGFPTFLEKFGFESYLPSLQKEDTATLFRTLRPSCLCDGGCGCDRYIGPFYYTHPKITCSAAAAASCPTIIYNFDFTGDCSRRYETPAFRVLSCAYCAHHKLKCDLTSLVRFKGKMNSSATSTKGKRKSSTRCTLKWKPGSDEKPKEALERRMLRRAGLGEVEVCPRNDFTMAVASSLAKSNQRMSELEKDNAKLAKDNAEMQGMLEQERKERADRSARAKAAGEKIQRLFAGRGVAQVTQQEEDEGV